VFHEVEPVELRARCAPRLHKMIKAAADESARSMSAEIAYRLRKSFDREEAGQTRSASMSRMAKRTTRTLRSNGSPICRPSNTTTSAKRLPRSWGCELARWIPRLRQNATRRARNEETFCRIGMSKRGQGRLMVLPCSKSCANISPVTLCWQSTPMSLLRCGLCTPGFSRLST
jgi:hypothetical protein